MNSLPLTFIVNSPQELRETLAGRKPDENSSIFAALVISGPQVLVRTFQLPKAAAQETKTKLQAQAVQLLSLPLNDIEFDYQIFHATGDEISGLFVGIPKSLLKEYISVLDDAKLIPVKLTPAIVAAIEAFYQGVEMKEGRNCLLDLSSPQKINLAIFSNKYCEFLREIPYDNIAEAKAEIIQTLRSACATSKVKQFEHAWWVGDSHGKEELIGQVEKNLGVKIEPIAALDIKEGLAAEDKVFILNLLRQYSFSLGERKKILTSLDMIFKGLLAGCVLFAAVNAYFYKVIQDIKATYTAAQYEQAHKLEQQLKALK